MTSLLDEWIDDLIFNALDCGSVVMASIIFEQDEKQYKTRPMLVIDVSNGKLYGFQITGVPPSAQAWKKLAIKNWSEIGLAKPSYINYDHLVEAKQADVYWQLHNMAEEDLLAFKQELAETRLCIKKYDADKVCHIIYNAF